jgi:hypothetical protein
MNTSLRRSVYAIVCALLISSPSLLAHEGHLHKVMGTVVAAEAAQLQVKGTDGKTLSLVVDKATHVIRGTQPIKVTELHAGERVVASYMPMKANGAEMLMAKEVKAAAASSPAAAH